MWLCATAARVGRKRSRRGASFGLLIATELVRRWDVSVLHASLGYKELASLEEVLYYKCNAVRGLTSIHDVKRKT